MSAIGDAVRTKLLSYSAVTTLISQRMYTDVLPERATLPAVLFYVTSTEREHYLEGVTKAAHARIMFECYAATRTTAGAISKAIRETGIDSFAGTVSGYAFQGCDFEDGDEYMQDPPTDGNQAHRYIVSFQMLVHYQEP
jgi:hypothetical protein